MTITLGEAIKRNTTHQEAGQDAIGHAIDTTGAYAFVVIQVVTVECGTLVFLQRGVAVNIECRGQNQFANHLLECLSSLFQAMAFESVTKYLVKENTAGRT